MPWRNHYSILLKINAVLKRVGRANEALSEAGHWGLDVGMDVLYAVVRGDVSCQSDRFGDENFG